MRFLRFLGVSCALAIIGFAGVSAAVATASVFGHMSSWVVDFAFGWCTLPAIVLAAVAFGLVHLVERVWTRLASSHRLETRPLGQRVLSAVVTRFSTSSATGATTSSSFHTSVSAEPMPPPSLLVLGVLVAVPLAARMAGRRPGCARARRHRGHLCGARRGVRPDGGRLGAAAPSTTAGAYVGVAAGVAGASDDGAFFAGGAFFVGAVFFCFRSAS